MLDYIIFLLSRISNIHIYDPFSGENQPKTKIAKKRMVNNLLGFYDRTLGRASQLSEADRTILQQSR